MKIGWRERLNLEYPVIQAGMGGGISSADLASAVSTSGGLGTVGMMPPKMFRSELKAVRERCCGRPFSANLLMPFVRRAHVEACLAELPAVVSVFFGFDSALVERLKAAGIMVLHQVGSADQARRALECGADGLIAQGEEAGGHLAGTTPLAQLIPIIRQIAGTGQPVFGAGGVYNDESARAVMRLGADGVVAGTRFLLTPESNAHFDYKTRLLEADETLRTRLFGLAWPASHRVVPNNATKRWCRQDSPDGPGWAMAVNAAAAISRRMLPMEIVTKLVRLQRVGIPLYSPAPVIHGMDPQYLDVTPLYAGRCVRQIRELQPAGKIVAMLAKGCAQ
jgi:nitronate monooxygenase